MKNEELCRIQNELEQECDQFRKLKKIIQDHGLPNHEQLVILQQQVHNFIFVHLIGHTSHLMRVRFFFFGQIICQIKVSFIFSAS